MRGAGAGGGAGGHTHTHTRSLSLSRPGGTRAHTHTIAQHPALSSHTTGRFALPVPAFLRGGATPAGGTASSSAARRTPNPTTSALAAANTLDNGPVVEEDYEGQLEEAELDPDFTVKRITGDGRCMFRALVRRGGTETDETENT